MQDRYGRQIDYLRISITDRCNLRCRYCMPEDIGHLPMNEILTYEEIVFIVREAVTLGIDKIKITGGEPLIRRGCPKLIKMLKGIEGIKEVSITTNGVLLEEYLTDIVVAGIDGINISLDTLDHERYRTLTGFDGLDRVLDGLDAAVKSGLPVKINAVSMVQDKTKDDLYADVFALIELTRKRPVDVRFIELMPIGAGRGVRAIPHDDLMREIIGMYPEIHRDLRRHGNGPSVYYRIPGYKGSIGLISAIHGNFCDSCNRIRLTSRGYLKSCLSYDMGVDLKSVIRGSMEEDEIAYAVKKGIEEAILCKPQGHSFLNVSKVSEKNAMSAIGG